MRVVRRKYLQANFSFYFHERVFQKRSSFYYDHVYRLYEINHFEDFLLMFCELISYSSHFHYHEVNKMLVIEIHN